MTLIEQLNIPVPKIEILGESDIYAQTGSTVHLKCVITQSLEEPAYIFWYHDNERVLNYDRSVLDIRMERISPDTTVGTLIIYHGRPSDSGNYTCSPSNLDSASVLLHVLNGNVHIYIYSCITCVIILNLVAYYFRPNPTTYSWGRYIFFQYKKCIILCVLFFIFVCSL